MKISLKWLNEFVQIDDFMSRPEELAVKLTDVGLEVESIHTQSEPFKKVVIGHIVELNRHPNADRLTVCQVDVGEGSLRQIVCGATNHRQGDYVVAALPGAVLPGNFAIKESKIRDVESKGMLCSVSELGLAKESEGIMILPKGSQVGQLFSEYYGLDDVLIEINVTPNRADCLSHWGLARELASILGRTLSAPVPQVKALKHSTRSAIKVHLKAPHLCPRYAARLVKKVKVGPSPDWLKRRLESLDVNSINNVVDVTNYVMLELGQPLHAFDLRELKGGVIQITEASPHEKFTTFDGTELTLTPDDLTIRDGERAVALAGVIGGKNSGVTESTEDLVIESAHFTAETVRKSMRRHGIQTDSSYRFSRGTDPEGVLIALNRACELMAELASGEVADDFYDEYPKPLKRDVISLERQYVSDRLGYDASGSELVESFQRLGCMVTEVVKNEKYLVQPPAFRWDLHDKTDLVEEYARLKGYDAIPESFPVLASEPLTHDMGFKLQDRAAEALKCEGFLQAKNYGFTSSKFTREFLGDGERLKNLGVKISALPVKLVNPLNEDLDVMRTSLLPSLWQNALHNCRYGAEQGRLFEIGAVFEKGEEGYKEEWRLGLMAWGQVTGLWNKDEARPVVYDLKTAIEGFADRMGISPSSRQWIPLDNPPEFLHPRRAVALSCEGRVVGFLGSLHPRLLEESKVRVDVALGEIDFSALMRGQPRVAKARPISKFPLVHRDLAVLIPDQVNVSEVEKLMRKTLGSTLQLLEPYDVFKGQGVPEGHRSVTFKMSLQNLEGTLTEDKLSALHKSVIDALQNKMGLAIR